MELSRRGVIAALVAAPLALSSVPALAVGNGPEYGGKGNITTAHLATYEDLAAFHRLYAEAAERLKGDGQA